MKSCLSVGLFYNCQPVRIGLWFNSEREFVAADSPVPKLGSSILEACSEPVEGLKLPVSRSWSFGLKIFSQGLRTGNDHFTFEVINEPNQAACFYPYNFHHLFYYSRFG
ncbi:MAG: hypothetical protein Q7T96_18750 [Methylobacter sp.]|nr:hypothetical protein [Methylobacter sp.]